MKTAGEILAGNGTKRDESCNLHGAYVSRHIIGRVWTKCPECVRLSQIESDNAEALKREEERKKAEDAAWARKLGFSGIPERFHGRSVASYIATTEGQKKALEFATDYAKNFPDVLKTGRSALFVGKPGTGKTHLAAAIGLHVMSEFDETVVFTTVMRALRRVKDTWAKGSEESESQAIESFVYPSLLILDEVGVQFGSDFEKNILFDIFNERYEKRRPTILMSNLPVSEVTAYLGERVIDRIREDKGARIVFDWESYRGRPA